MQLNPFSSTIRPAIAGRKGAVSAAHPLAAAAGQVMLAQGGTAADALIAAQAVLTVVAPGACGLGGDGFVLFREANGAVFAVNGAGAAARAASAAAASGGASVAVPGLVDLWHLLSARAGRLGLKAALAPARELAEEGVRADASLIAARDRQVGRLKAGGAGGWPLMRLRAGEMFRQPALAATLSAIAEGRREAFYGGALGAAILRTVRAHGGALAEADLSRPAAEILPSLKIPFAGMTVHAQPPMSQGVLLLMALKAWEESGFRPGPNMDHLGVELTQGAFAFRDEAGRGAALLEERLTVDPERAQGRGGPRAYLHTAGVAAADAEGRVAASLVSVFDDFGSAVFVPEGGFVLNNRAGGFTGGANAFAPGKRPVHTLAPALIEGPQGVVALATPGADGQVQTLLQVILRWAAAGEALPQAVAAPRWRSENGKLLVEAGHPARDDLLARGHEVVDAPSGDMRFGAINAAGLWGDAPFALPDWRRTTWAGVA